MKNWDIVILTEDQYVNPVDDSPFVQNLMKEDHLVIEAFESLGLSAGRASWSDASFDWSSTRGAIIRGTWDYIYHLDRFHNRLQEISTRTALVNPYDIVQWNIDKHYLQELSQKGVRIVPTTYFEQGTEVSLSSIFAQNDGKPIIIKPVVSATASNTFKVTSDNVEEIQQVMSKLLEDRSMMVQPFQENVVSQGEYSFIVIDGVCTHAVQKIPKANDFRVQDDFGGSVHEYVPSKSDMAFAEQVIAVCGRSLAYARVDALIDNEGNLALMELELIEPELWFRLCPSAANKLAAAVVRTVV